MTNKRWHTELFTIAESETLPVSVKVRLMAWQRRFEFYNQLNWTNEIKFERQADHLILALKAYDELQKQGLNDEHVAMLHTIEKNIDYYLTKLEASQLALLEKTDEFKREELNNKLNEIKQYKREEKARIHLANASDPDQHPLTNLFFNAHQRRIPFGKRIKRGREAYTWIKLLSVAEAVSRGISQLSAPLHKSIEIATPFLASIPVISSIFYGVPILLGSFKAWRQNKSTTHRAVTSMKIGVVAAGIAITLASIFVPPLGFAAAAGVAAVFIAIDIGDHYIKPLITTSKKISATKKQLRRLENKIQKNRFTYKGHAEKKILLIAVEKKWIRGECTQAEFEEAKRCIAAGSRASLISNPLTKPFINSQFLSEKIKDQISLLQNDLKDHKKNQRKYAIKSTNGILMIIGALLICVPTPITLLVGASLLAATSITSIVLKRYWPDKDKLTPHTVADTTPTNNVDTNAHRVLRTIHREPTPAPKIYTTTTATTQPIKDPSTPRRLH